MRTAGRDDRALGWRWTNQPLQVLPAQDFVVENTTLSSATPEMLQAGCLPLFPSRFGWDGSISALWVAAPTGCWCWCRGAPGHEPQGTSLLEVTLPKEIVTSRGEVHLCLCQVNFSAEVAHCQPSTDIWAAQVARTEFAAPSPRKLCLDREVAQPHTPVWGLHPEFLPRRRVAEALCPRAAVTQCHLVGPATQAGAQARKNEKHGRRRLPRVRRRIWLHSRHR